MFNKVKGKYDKVRNVGNLGKVTRKKNLVGPKI